MLNGGVTPQKLSTGGPTWDATGKLDLTGNLSVGGTATITGDAALSGDITVTGSKTLSGTQLQLDCRGGNIGESSNSTAVLNVGNVGGGNTQSIHAEGTSNLVGDVTCGSTLTVTGNTTLGGNLAVTGTITDGSGTPKVLARSKITLVSGSPISSFSYNATVVADTAKNDGDVKAYKLTMATAAPNDDYTVIVQQAPATMGAVATNTIKMAAIEGTGDLDRTTTQFYFGVDNPPDFGTLIEITVLG